MCMGFSSVIIPYTKLNRIKTHFDMCSFYPIRDYIIN